MAKNTKSLTVIYGTNRDIIAPDGTIFTANGRYSSEQFKKHGVRVNAMLATESISVLEKFEGKQDPKNLHLAEPVSIALENDIIEEDTEDEPEPEKA